MDALIAVTAILLPASVTLVGYWYREQSERRRDEEEKQSEQRLALEREQTERRLAQEHTEKQAQMRLDAAMRAGSLFGSGQDAQSSPASSASGLLALTELGHADLAVALLVDLWPGRDVRALHSTASANDTESARAGPSGQDVRVSNETAILVINSALRAHNLPNAQLVAAELLCRNAPGLDPCQSLHWPAAIDGQWLPGLHPRAKLLILNGLILMTTSRRPADESALRSLVVRLYGVWRGDNDGRVRGCVGVLLCALIPALERLSMREFMQAGETVTLGQIREAAQSASPNPDGYLERMTRAKADMLEHWSRTCDVCDLALENLGMAGH